MFTKKQNHFSSLASVIVWQLCFSSIGTLAAEPTSFRTEIAPVLLDRCIACHSAQKSEGGYRLDTFEDLLKAGDSGEAPVAQAEGQPSELLRRLRSTELSERMPLDAEPLLDEQIKLVEKWIAEGAKFDGGQVNQSLALVVPPEKYSVPPESYSTAVPLTAIAFSPDGMQVVSGGYHELTIWNATDGKLLRRITDIGERTFAIAFSTVGQTMAVACGEPGRNGEVRLIDFATGEVKGVVARSADCALDVAFRPNSRELAVAAADNQICIVNLDTLAVVRTLANHADWVTAIAWSDDGSRLVSASRDKSAKVYDGASGQLLASYPGHGAAVRGVVFTPDGKQVISSGSDNKLHRWDVEGGKLVAEIPLGAEGYKIIRNEGFIYVPCANKRLVKVDLATNKISQEYLGHEDWVLSVGLQANQGHLISGAIDGQAKLWNANDGSLIQAWLAKP